MKRYLLCLCLLTIFALSGCSPLPVSDEKIPITQEKQLIFDERRYTYTGNEHDIAIEDDRLIIQEEGTYRLSGNLKEGSICIRVAPNECDRLILSGISIQSSYHSPLDIESAACVTLILENDCVNTIGDTPRKIESEADFLPISCVRAYSDLILQGTGTLVISGRSACAIACSENLLIESGQITLSAAETAIWVRDQFSFKDGSLTVTAAQYGVTVSEGDSAFGTLEILGGRISMVCSEIALSAGKSILISAGNGSLQAPLVYRCERNQNGDVHRGIIQIESSGFPIPSS